MPHRGDFRGLMPSPRRRPAAGGSPAGAARTSAPAPRQEAARDPGGRGIRVSDVAVGVIAAQVNAATLADPAKGHRLQEIVPLQRMGRHGQTAGTALFLGSSRSYVTGSACFAAREVERRVLRA